MDYTIGGGKMTDLSLVPVFSMEHVVRSSAGVDSGGKKVRSLKREKNV